jgi:alpha-tubulin suppressor-like RCC1 family protein
MFDCYEPNNVVAITAGRAHTVALKNDGSVWTQGNNYYGALGHSFSGCPGQVSGLSDVISIEANRDFNIALKSDGTVWAWGKPRVN